MLVILMVLGCVPGFAENTKHERVYIVATADGTVKSITDSVRLENADGLDQIMDQTILTNIQSSDLESKWQGYSLPGYVR